ncbi:translesion error-prone DNA polymerase V autoproteolytic subunit [Polaribacter sp.]|uniref:LexA family protein n=1 Tax=Polaribacter sp. TaxID=1920175 RepID=UPI0025F61A78|nr:translesion error-prone DNA polymerase V autoproteolytic subunit [Polaribacter sp.]
MDITSNLIFFKPEKTPHEGALLIDTGISAGFPSNTEDIVGEKISLDESLIKNKNTTFYAKVRGQSMINAGLNHDDLLVIDRSLEPVDKKIAVCYIDGEFTVKRLRVKNDEIWLQPENPNYPIINITEDNDFMIWGIVTNVIKKV